MKNNFNFILIILIIILILSGLGIVLYRQQLFVVLNEKSDIPDTNTNEYVSEISVSDTLDLEVLDNKTLNSLENKVKDFDIEDVCGLSSTNCITGTARPFESIKVNEVN
ncbi:MAG: hypothetical protein PF488_01695 [Patescibacteria group bacterium]|jgi:hypothetical protein|nr:hypothetical protein [Patescibacteria group bacterium]